MGFGGEGGGGGSTFGFTKGHSLNIHFPSNKMSALPAQLQCLVLSYGFPPDSFSLFLLFLTGGYRQSQGASTPLTRQNNKVVLASKRQKYFQQIRALTLPLPEHFTADAHHMVEITTLKNQQYVAFKQAKWKWPQ